MFHLFSHASVCTVVSFVQFVVGSHPTPSSLTRPRSGVSRVQRREIGALERATVSRRGFVRPPHLRSCVSDLVYPTADIQRATCRAPLSKSIPPPSIPTGARAGILLKELSHLPSRSAAAGVALLSDQSITVLTTVTHHPTPDRHASDLPVSAVRRRVAPYGAVRCPREATVDPPTPPPGGGTCAGTSSPLHAPSTSVVRPACAQSPGFVGRVAPGEDVC